MRLKVLLMVAVAVGCVGVAASQAALNPKPAQPPTQQEIDDEARERREFEDEIARLLGEPDAATLTAKADAARADQAKREAAAKAAAERAPTTASSGGGTDMAALMRSRAAKLSACTAKSEEIGKTGFGYVDQANASQSRTAALEFAGKACGVFRDGVQALRGMDCSDDVISTMQEPYKQMWDMLTDVYKTTGVSTSCDAG